MATVPVAKSTDRDKAMVVMRLSSGALWLTILAAALLSHFYDVESILVTGPTGLILGLWVASRGLKCRVPLITWFGFGTVAFVVFVFALINLNNWGPPDAQEPVSLLIGCFAALSVPFGVYGTFARNVAVPLNENSEQN